MEKGIAVFLFLLNWKIYPLIDFQLHVKFAYIFIENIKYKIKVTSSVNIADAEDLTF